MKKKRNLFGNMFFNGHMEKSEHADALPFVVGCHRGSVSVANEVLQESIVHALDKNWYENMNNGHVIKESIDYLAMVYEIEPEHLNFGFGTWNPIKPAATSRSARQQWKAEFPRKRMYAPFIGISRMLAPLYFQSWFRLASLASYKKVFEYHSGQIAMLKKRRAENIALAHENDLLDRHQRERWRAYETGIVVANMAKLIRYQGDLNKRPTPPELIELIAKDLEGYPQI